MTEEFAALYVVPTPLGNLGDLTQRAAEILRAVPWVAAEDTRHSAPLLKHVGSAARLLPAHRHNEHEAAARIVERLRAGEPEAAIVAGVWRSCMRLGPKCRSPDSISSAAALKLAASWPRTESLSRSNTFDMKFAGAAFSSRRRTR